MTTEPASAAGGLARFLDPRLDNWPLAFALAVAVSALSLVFLP